MFMVSSEPRGVAVAMWLLAKRGDVCRQALNDKAEAGIHCSS